MHEFGNTPEEAEPSLPLELHRCPEKEACGGESVQADCEWLGADIFDVMLHCPDCQWSGRRICNGADVERFEEVWYEGLKTLAKRRNILSRANQEEEMEYIERFVAALQADAILPEDFDNA